MAIRFLKPIYENTPYVEHERVWLFERETAVWPTTVTMTHNCTVNDAPWATSVASLSSRSIIKSDHGDASVIDNVHLLSYINYSSATAIAGVSLDMEMHISLTKGLYWEIEFNANSNVGMIYRYFIKRCTANDQTPWGTLTEYESSGGYYQEKFTQPTYITLSP